MPMNFSKLSILVIEDLEPMRKLLTDILKSLGVGTVYTAANGEKGYNMYAIKKPDLIITDWHMPEMDGLELLEKIRKNPKSPNRTIPVIMISGFCAPQRISKARDLGATEFLVKPFSASDLEKRLSHTINTPRDFIVTPNFVGPDRRRKDDENFSGKTTRKKETDKKITAKKDLQSKTGKGNINPQLIQNSQNIIENNTIDFTPIMKSFLNEFKRSIDVAQNLKTSNRKIIEDLIFPIMQIKANARIFKYDLIGDLSTIILNFLESAHQVDKLIIEILYAQHKTISHLVEKDLKGDCGKVGESLKAELQDACNRYLNSKVQILQNELRQKKAESS
ncbi:MAG: response regulator [Alphaproteobacteria bacterium]